MGTDGPAWVASLRELVPGDPLPPTVRLLVVRLDGRAKKFCAKAIAVMSNNPDNIIITNLNSRGTFEYSPSHLGGGGGGGGGNGNDDDDGLNDGINRDPLVFVEIDEKISFACSSVGKKLSI